MRKKARISEQLIGTAIAEDSSYVYKIPHITRGQVVYYLLWRNYVNQKRAADEAKQLELMHKLYGR